MPDSEINNQHPVCQGQASQALVYRFYTYMPGWLVLRVLPGMPEVKNALFQTGVIPLVAA